MQSIVIAEEMSGGDLASAEAALLSGENQLAIDRYASAISTHQLEGAALAKALLNKALAEQRSKLHQAAIDDYTAALDVGSLITAERAIALYNRGLSHQLLNELPVAIEDYTAALFLAPKMPQAYMSRANALRESGQYLFALSDYDRAIRYDHPDKARVHFAAAVTYMALNRNSDAERELNAVLEVNPDHVAARQKLEELKRQTQNQPSSATEGSGPTAVALTLGSTEISKPDNAPAVVPPDTLVSQETTAAPAPTPSSPTEQSQTAATVPAPLVVAKPDISLATEPPPAIASAAPIAEPNAAPSPADPELQTSSTTAAGDGSTSADIAPPAQIPAEANTGWSVQLGSASSEDGARATWAKMQKKYSALRDLNPAFVRADLGTKGIFYRIRQTGFADAGAAKSACQAYKKSGIACFVSQSNG